MSTITDTQVKRICIINRLSTQNQLNQDKDILPTLRAIQKQLNNEFKNYWGLSAKLYYAPPGIAPPKNMWSMFLLDTSDVAGALGYHDANSVGIPQGKVFVKTVKNSDAKWSITLSHEILEALVDPWGMTSFFQDFTSGMRRLVAMECCLTGDTKIPLLDGTEVAIKDLVGRDHFWVYSCDEDGKVVVGKGHSARLTRKQSLIVEITLDNEEKIRCTPDHKFLLRNGEYIEASELKEGQSLMPLYRRHHTLFTGKKKGFKKEYQYEQVFDNSNSEWSYTHQVAAPNCPKGYVRHHKDLNRFNNSPDNIEIMKWSDHSVLHRELLSEYAKKWSKDLVEKGLHPFQRPNVREKVVKAGAARLREYNKTDKHRKEASKIAKKTVFTNIHDNPVVKRLLNELSGKRLSEYNKTEKHKQEILHYIHSERGIEIASNTAKKNNHQRWHVDRNIINKEKCELCAVYNHKVKSVRVFDTFEDVYDITVDKYHNFALSSGVFVHNCDPCEADKYGYQIDGIWVSNFVTPYWYHAFEDVAEYDNDLKYDYKGLIKKPFTTLPGCHQSYYYISGAPQGVSNLNWSSKNFQLGDVVEIYSHEGFGIGPAALKKRGWTISFKTPDPQLVEKFNITKEEVVKAIEDAFNPPEGSRRDIRFKGLSNVRVNESQVHKDEEPGEVLNIDPSF